jgi:uncharacterized protein YdaU (DUF1376 family)
MPRMPYFHCYPDDFLVGTQGLSDELGMAYFRIVMKIYSTGGSLPYDTEWLRHLLGKKDKRPVTRIVKELLALGKLRLDEEGRLMNGRAAQELGKYVKRDEPSSPQSRGQSSPQHRGQHRGQSQGESQPEKPIDPTRAHAVARPPVPESRSYNLSNRDRESTTAARDPMLANLQRRLDQFKNRQENDHGKDSDPTGHHAGDPRSARPSKAERDEG